MTKPLESLTEAQLLALSPPDLLALERATSKLGDMTQRQAAHYQRQADRMRKLMARRKREARA